MKKNNRKTWWQCKDGTLVKIRDTGDGHLLNTVRMLKRKWRNYCYASALLANSYAFHPMTPDGASDAAASEADQMMEDAETFDGLFDECPQFQALLDECERRGLDPDESPKEAASRKQFKAHEALWENGQR